MDQIYSTWVFFGQEWFRDGDFQMLQVDFYSLQAYKPIFDRNAAQIF